MSFIDAAKLFDFSRNTLSTHYRKHLGAGPRTSGPRPVSGDFLTDVRDFTHDRLTAGELEPGLKDGIAAQKHLDARAARATDADLMLKIALALTGQVAGPVYRDPEVEAIEAEFRPLLDDPDVPPALPPGPPVERAKPWRSERRPYEAGPEPAVIPRPAERPVPFDDGLACHDHPLGCDRGCPNGRPVGRMT